MLTKPAIGVVGLTLCCVPLGAVAWEPNAAQLEQLRMREILVSSAVDPGGAAGRAQAAVQIAAPPALVYQWMTDCQRALQFVPKLTACRVVSEAADRRSQVIAHEVNYNWLLPRTRYTFRAEYTPAQSVRFKTIEGDLAINEGEWRLQAVDATQHTIVTYDVRIKPKVYVPRWIVRRSLGQDLPELLASLRRASEAAVAKPAP
jgi:ribosome-associated toxin RatA of RatAB toxin-antitoxin module